MSSTYRDELRLVIGNQLREELPSAVPGLTKQAYEEIIQNAVDSIPMNIEAMEKAAAPVGLATALQEGAMRHLGAVGVATVAGATLFGLKKAIDTVGKNRMYPAFQQALQHAINSPDRAGEILRAADRKKVNSFAETIFNYAPHVASDPNLLKGVLAESVYGDSLAPGTIKALVELEEKRQNMSSFKPQDLVVKG